MRLTILVRDQSDLVTSSFAWLLVGCVVMRRPSATRKERDEKTERCELSFINKGDSRSIEVFGVSSFTGLIVSTLVSKLSVLACNTCKEKDDAITDKLDMLDARLCPRSCGIQLFRHSEKCKAKLRIQLTREELDFLTFRPAKVTKYFLTDVDYYMRLGVIH